MQYEDYLLRLMYGAGIPTARPYGFVEITPEREYLLVTEFFDGAVEISDAVIDDGVIDDALAVVRRLWDAGLAHRDVKPANILVRDQRVLLIDVAFAEVRPSPWRQAVDLANMMLVLGPGLVPRARLRAGRPGVHARGDRRGLRRHPGHRPHQPAPGPPALRTAVTWSPASGPWPPPPPPSGSSAGACAGSASPPACSSPPSSCSKLLVSTLRGAHLL